MFESFGKQRLVGLLLIIVFASGCAGAVRPDNAGADVGPGPTVAKVYLVRRGWHIDVALGARDLHAELEPLARALGTPQYVVIGFGDRRYLQASKHGFAAMLAALWPGDGVMLVTGLRASPGAAFGTAHVIALAADKRRMTALQRYVRASFSGELRPAAPGPYEGSLFFAATASYSAAHTCNTWAAETLHAAGLPIDPRGVAFAGQLWSQASELHALQR